LKAMMVCDVAIQQVREVVSATFGDTVRKPSTARGRWFTPKRTSIPATFNTQARAAIDAAQRGVS
jgi:hypothetical protein